MLCGAAKALNISNMDVNKNALGVEQEYVEKICDEQGSGYFFYHRRHRPTLHAVGPPKAIKNQITNIFRLQYPLVCKMWYIFC
jgi:hypothetical protein